MKDKKFKKLIQKPLRFHHQDIHEELEELKEMIKDVSSQMQVLQQRVEEQYKDTSMRLSKQNDIEGGQGFGLGSK